MSAANQLDSPIDWTAVMHAIGATYESPNESVVMRAGGTQVAQRALAALIGENNLRAAVDWYVDLQDGFEVARSVLMHLQAPAARERCVEIYRSDADRHRRVCAVQLFRDLAVREDLPLVAEFMTDPDEEIQIWGICVLDQLVWHDHVDDAEADPLLLQADSHPNPRVRERGEFIRGVIEGRDNPAEDPSQGDDSNR